MILNGFKVQLKGKNSIRVINATKKQNIILQNLSFKDCYEFDVKSKFMPTLTQLCNDYCVELVVVKKIGVGDYILKLKNNLPFVFASIICLVFLIVATQYVFNVKIECENVVYKQKVESLISKQYHQKPVLKSNIDLKKIENLILENVDEVTFATCYIDGMSLKIKILANEPANIEEKKDNLTANCDAIITRVFVRNGTSEVKVGDRVKKGDILIGGYHIADNTPTDGEENGERIDCIADGEVYGKTYIHKRFLIPNNPITFVRTGNTKKQVSLGFNDKFFGKKSKKPFAYCEYFVSSTKIFNILPLCIKTTEYYELKKVSISQNAYIEQLKSKFEKEVLEQTNFNGKILAKDFDLKTIDNNKYLDIFYEIEKRIDNGGQNY